MIGRQKCIFVYKCLNTNRLHKAASYRQFIRLQSKSNMKKKFTNLFFIAIILSTTSCKEKLTCNNQIALNIVEQNVKIDFIEAWALSKSAEEFKTDNYKFKYDWYGNMSKDYKSYLLSNLDDIRNKKGNYYAEAVERYTNYGIKLENIITESYDDSTDKCECSASFEPTNSNMKNSITYKVIKNSDGQINVRYKFLPKATIDDKKNASAFIKENDRN